MKKNHKILELDKIIDKLSQEIILESNLQYMDDDDLILHDIEDINDSLDEVDEAAQIILRLNRFPLFFTKDTTLPIIKTTKFGILSVEELLEIGKLLDTIKNIIIFNDSLLEYQIKKDHFNFYTSLLIYPKEINLRIKEIVNQFGEILDTASPLLKSIRDQLKASEKSISSKLVEIINKNSSKLSSSIVSIRNDRYVIPVKNDYKNQIKGIMHDQSASGETVFIEPMVIYELNNKINSLKEDEKKEITRILRDISSRISEHSYDLLQNYKVIEKLDLIFAKASLSNKLNGSRVKINNTGIVELMNCYHPLLNVKKIVKNNIIIGKEYQGIIITGPNTGGKTVLLKTIGLLSLMIKMGLLIPCNPESNIAIFDDVYADIGDEQSIDQNLSTFSSHLKNVIEIMNNITCNSLVLLDELGSGTDPTEGAALAISIFDFLLTRKCLVIASSHYAELKIHAYESPNIINASVEFDTNSLKPTYKLLIGIPGESNALKISKILGLPDEIINKAENYAYNNSNEINLTLEKLINQSNVLDKKLNELHDKDINLSMKLEEADKIIEDARNEKKDIISKANKEAEKYISDSLKKINTLIEELNEMKLREVKAHEIANIKGELKDLKESLDVSVDPLPTKTNIEVNDHVFIESYNAYGVVIRINKNRYDISVGNTVITVKKDDLKLTKQEVQVGLTKKTTGVITPRKTVKASLDLRGMRYEDAEPLIDSYLYDAAYSGLHQVSIIHGFGTGVIRELVQNKLKTNHNVESFRYGGQNEGGQGATIVTLK